MRRPEIIARQARCPSGFLGHVLARVMAHETAADNARAVELLAPRPTDHVLEVGFAHGRTIRHVANLARNGFVAGVEISPRMLRMASRFNRALIEQGRVELKLGEGIEIPYGDARFDGVFSVHTLYFWRSPRDTLAEIRRVLKADGRLVLGFRSGEDPGIVRDFPSSVYRFYRGEEVESLLDGAGFGEVHLGDSGDGPRRMVVALARRGPA